MRHFLSAILVILLFSACVSSGALPSTLDSEALFEDHSLRFFPELTAC